MRGFGEEGGWDWDDFREYGGEWGGVSGGSHLISVVVLYSCGMGGTSNVSGVGESELGCVGGRFKWWREIKAFEELLVEFDPKK